MIEYLNEDEVFRVGMCIEQAGLEFYTKMAKKAKDDETKAVFQKLAEDEKGHLKLFESKELETAGGMGSRPAEMDTDVSAYVCSIVDGGIFKGIEEMAKYSDREFDPESALELALSVEKDAVLYYTEAMHAATKPAAKEALAELVEEEKRHVVEISKRLEEVRK
ncbi:MAG: hypothetical protein GF405_07615 [Candidatus Eisenbacteria bacterium]|nr:hypothetical protein [Candidatus Eisenbacteria bacterium]